MPLLAEGIAAWSDALRANEAWVAALEAAFDAVGFTDNYVASPADIRGRRLVKAVKDRVWGMIELDSASMALVDCPLFQRLRQVSQLGFTYLTYPTARHSRFEHSLGAFHVVGRLLDSFRVTAALDAGTGERTRAVSFEAPEQNLIRHAALLHDVGHAAFSHVTEKAFERAQDTRTVGPYTVTEFMKLFRGACLTSSNIFSKDLKLSELMSVAFVTSDRFRTFYEVRTGVGDYHGLHPTLHIGALMLGHHVAPGDRALPQILSGPVDADKIDYMQRDSQACGISLGIDIARVFLRAGVYQVPTAARLPSGMLEELPEGPVRIFVIDQSGTDTVTEMVVIKHAFEAGV
ncbi:MAG: HD domain-containing protein, partial [Myxococcota bacterium]